MKTRMITVLITLAFLSLTSLGQQTDLFIGENYLVHCQVNIPLTYDKKDKASLEKAALENKDTKLVLLHFDKKIKKASYSTYYIVVDKSTDETFVYLLTPESYISNKKQAHFISFNPKYDRFYTEECF